MTDLDIAGLKLVGSGFTSDLSQALTAANMERTIDGGSTLNLTVADYRRLLVTSGVLAGSVGATVDKLNFELVQVRKSGNMVTLTLEDAVVTEMKRPRGKLIIPQSTMTRGAIAKRLADEAGVRIEIDPADRDRGVFNSEFSRDQDGDSWEPMKTLATDIGWRCFSDGNRLFFGGDEWLATLTAPVELTEGQVPLLSDIDFDMDVAQPASSASFTVAAERWALPPGRSVELKGIGWGDGVWLVRSFKRRLTSARADVELTRRALVLAEPPPQAAGESGEDGFVPDDNGDITADLARLRQCESGGNYQANTGNGYYGAYQFDLRTWQKDLGYSGRPDQAPPATQDEAATKLYQKRGWKPWPACSKKLGLVDRRSVNKTAGANTTTGNAGRDAFVRAMLTIQGAPYQWGGNGPYAKGWDCSGAVQMAAAKAGKPLAKPARSQWATGRSKGQVISVAEGIRTRGALLVRINSGATDHIAMSLGDGSTIEAQGKKQGCRIVPNAASRTWTGAFIWI